jgi:hypothetical protein
MVDHHAGPERVAVLHAVFDGERPTDDRVRVAARRFAERYLSADEPVRAERVQA